MNYVVLLWLVSPVNAAAEIRTITATGEYRMGDNDTRTDAKRLALLDAKRLALEQAGIYIESITEARNLDLTKEEIRAYTAGIVEVVEQTTRTATEGETTVIRVDVTTKIDTETVAQQIEALRKNEDLKFQLLKAEFEAYKLRKELEATTQQLASAKSRAMAEAVTRQRQRLLTHADVEDLVTRARVVLAGSKGYTLAVGTSTPESRKYARSLIEEALAHEPENLEAQGLLGFLLFEEGHPEESIAAFHKIALMNPLSSQAHLNLGRVLEASDDYLGAVREYKTAIKLEPGRADAHVSLGRTVWHGSFLVENSTEDQKRTMRKFGIDELREATRLAPLNAEYHRELGARLLGSEMDGAYKEIQKAIDLDPSNVEGYKLLADVLTLKQDNKGATLAYRSAVRLNPTDPALRIDLGTMLLNDKDAKGAMAEFNEAVRVDPKNAMAHLRLGEALDQLGQLDRAIEEYRTAVNLGPVPFGKGHRLSFRVDVLADALTRAGKRKEAEQVIREHLKSNTKDEPYYGSYFREKLQELQRE